MTITEAEIRSALERAVEHADRSGPLPEGGTSAAPSRRPRARVLVVAGVVAVAAVVGLAVFAPGDGEQVRSGPPPAETVPSGVATSTSVAADDTTTTIAAATTSIDGTAVTTTAVAPSTPVVRVLNGSATSGAAGALTVEIAALGYRTGPVDNAWEPFDQSEVFFADGFEDAARDLAAQLGIERTSPLAAAGDLSADALAGSTIVVVVGTDRAAPPG